MHNEQKVSIIVPVFNSGFYLRKCLWSLVNQVHELLEIILINDGSTDSSKEIINEFAAKDNRIVAIHKENGGIGSAYKKAFEIMTGAYVLFVDSDDWLEQNAVENLVKLAVENDADLVSFGIRAFNTQGCEMQLPTLKNINLINTTNEAILKTHFEVLKHPTLVRLYKRELFRNIVVFEQNIGIDEMLTPQLLAKCNRAVYTTEAYYNVLIRQDSVCRAEYNEKKIRDTIKVYQFLSNFMENKIPEYASLIYEKHLGVAASLYMYTLQHRNEIDKETHEQARKEFSRIYRKYGRAAFPIGQPLKNKLFFMLLYFSPCLLKSFKFSKKEI